MRFLLFSDFHCFPGVFKAGDMEALRFLQRRAAEEHCDAIVHTGDLCHGAHLVPQLVEAYNRCPIRSFHSIGNHDADKTPYPEVLQRYGMDRGHYFADLDGFRLVFCDPNYLKNADGSFTHYSLENYVGRTQDKDWLPPDQLAWLEQTIAGSPYPCVLFSHQSFERECDGVQNAAEVRRIISAANRRRPHSVLLCVNGHNHRSNVRILDGVCYMEIPAACFDFVPIRHSLFPKEMEREFSSIANTVVFEHPLYAIAELNGSSIRVQGAETAMLMGVTAEMTGNAVFDAAGRMLTPQVQSFSLTL